MSCRWIRMDSSVSVSCMDDWALLPYLFGLGIVFIWYLFASRRNHVTFDKEPATKLSLVPIPCLANWCICGIRWYILKTQTMFWIRNRDELNPSYFQLCGAAFFRLTAYIGNKNEFFLCYLLHVQNVDVYILLMLDFFFIKSSIGLQVRILSFRERKSQQNSLSHIPGSCS